MSDSFNLLDRFPDMRPITKAPPLHTINGIGLTIVGSRDHDPDTGTYVTTHVFSVLFIPLIAFGAYRVANSEDGGYYFLGKVPLSRFARYANLLLCLAILLGGGYLAWHSYTSTPEYMARRKIDEADRLVTSEPGRSAKIYHDVLVSGPPDVRGTARLRLTELFDTPPTGGSDCLEVFRIALQAHYSTLIPMPDLFARGRKAAEDLAPQDPQNALEIVELVSPFADKPAEALALRRRLLEALVSRAPDNADLASRLAEVYEATGESDRCEKLLTPHEKNLKTQPGAAILGRIYAAKGKVDQAVALLEPYVASRLEQMTAAEVGYRSAVDGVQRSVIEDLNSGKAPKFDYSRYKGATEPEQRAMVDAYMDQRFQQNEAIKLAAQGLRAQAAVVPAALDLGLMQLQRAQKQADPARRKADLEAAEKTFVSVRSVAGNTDTYRLSLGQVYYWLGKQADGRKLFDEVLETHKHATEVALSVANVLREVGSTTEGRQLAEAAYEKEPDKRKKYQAAMMRSLMHLDLDDQILWLDRCDPSAREVQASLSSSRGHRAAQSGKDDEAAKHYQAAIAVYDKMSESSAVLNNSALVYFNLFRVTFEREHFTRALDRLERALALQPSDSILLTNTAHSNLEKALLDVIGDRLDFRVIRQSADWGLLSHLFTEVNGRRTLVEALRKQPGLTKAKNYFEKEMLLAPRRSSAYESLAQIASFFDDVKSLEAIYQRLAAADIDQEQRQKRTLDFISGKEDAKYREDIGKALSRMEQRLEPARKKGGTERAVAVLNVLSLRYATAALGDKVDLNEMVALAEEAHKVSPSDATRDALVGVLCFRAHLATRKTEPEYEAMVRRCERSLSMSLVNWVLGGPKSDLRDRLAANADIRRAATIRLEQVKDLPDRMGPITWSVLNATYPDDAAKLADRIRNNRRAELKRLIDLKLSPMSSTMALDVYLGLQIAGKPAEAAEVVKRSARAGIPWPELPGAPQ